MIIGIYKKSPKQTGCKELFILRFCFWCKRITLQLPLQEFL